MTWEQLYIYGASGHGGVVADAARAAGMPGLSGFVDDQREPQASGPPIVGDGLWLLAQGKTRALAIALGIGDNRARAEVAGKCLAAGITLASVVHPRATVADSARLGRGTVVMAGAVINPNAHIGDGCIINTGAVVEHDCHVGDYAHVSPNATMGGASRLGTLAQLGLGASLHPGVQIGDESIVGVGAAVVRTIPAGVVAMGVPARVIRPVTSPGS